MRIAIISDIHGNLPALEAVVRDFGRRGVDRVVNLGDSLSGPLLPAETAAFLMAQDWVQLAGNHERQLLADDGRPRGASDAFAHARLDAPVFEWIRSLPHRLQLDANVLLCHGTPDSDCTYFLETVDPAGVRLATPGEIQTRLGDVDAELIACGHTHLARSVRTARAQLIVNPGSVGLPAYEDSHPYPHRVETGSPDARYALVERIGDGWVASLIAVPYRWQPMAALARSRQRHDWACALASGHMS